MLRKPSLQGRLVQAEIDQRAITRDQGTPARLEVGSGRRQHLWKLANAKSPSGRRCLPAWSWTQAGACKSWRPPPGTSANLGGELFKSLAGIDITIVTYRGTGPLTTDLLGGHVKLGLNVLAPAMSMLKAASLKALAVLAQRRSSHLPDTPTSAEAGLPGFESGLNYGLLAPAGTPEAIIKRLNLALRAGIDTPDVRARIAADGGDPLPSTPQEYAADIAREEPKWSALIRKLGLRVD